VIITGYGTTENEARAKAAGVSEFVRKPLSPEMIEQSAEHALQGAAQAAPEIVADAQAQVEEQQQASRLKNIALFLAAPFIGLAYALMLPLVGMAMLAWTGWKALNATPAGKKTLNTVKSVALFVAAPFIGLVYAVSMPFVGTAMLLWVGGKAVLAHKQAA
jgi:hypothetical protein